MASIVGHLTIVPLYWLFPNTFSLVALILGSLLPDLDVAIRPISSWLVSRKRPELKGKGWGTWKSRWTKSWYLMKRLPLHNLSACLFLLVPVGVVLTRIIEVALGLNSAPLLMVIQSLMLALLSHLILDIPAHSHIRYFTPFEKPKPAPFYLFKKVQIFKRFYPFRDIEETLEFEPYAKLAQTNYLILSSFFPLLTASLLLFI